MLRRIDHMFTVLLLAVHAGLVLWALLGFAELVFPGAPWPRMNNPLFPTAMLVVQWAAIDAAGTVFLAGYALRWRRLAAAMAACYAVMAAICAVQTFTILTHDGRFLDMALEYAAYVAIVAYLAKSPAARRRLGAEPVPA